MKHHPNGVYRLTHPNYGKNLWKDCQFVVTVRNGEIDTPEDLSLTEAQEFGYTIERVVVLTQAELDASIVKAVKEALLQSSAKLF